MMITRQAFYATKVQASLPVFSSAKPLVSLQYCALQVLSCFVIVWQSLVLVRLMLTSPMSAL